MLTQTELVERFCGVGGRAVARLLQRHPTLDADEAESVAMEAAMTAAKKYVLRSDAVADTYAAAVIDKALASELKRGRFRADAIRRFAPVDLDAADLEAVDPADPHPSGEADVDGDDLVDRLLKRLRPADRGLLLRRLGEWPQVREAQQQPLNRLREAAADVGLHR